MCRRGCLMPYGGLRNSGGQPTPRPMTERTWWRILGKLQEQTMNEREKLEPGRRVAILCFLKPSVIPFCHNPTWGQAAKANRYVSPNGRASESAAQSSSSFWSCSMATCGAPGLHIPFLSASSLESYGNLDGL